VCVCVCVCDDSSRQTSPVAKCWRSDMRLVNAASDQYRLFTRSQRLETDYCCNQLSSCNITLTDPKHNSLQPTPTLGLF
jgi:hypothetical protein